MPGLRRHIPSKAFIREEKNKVEQNEKNYVGFRIPKISGKF